MASWALILALIWTPLKLLAGGPDGKKASVQALTCLELVTPLRLTSPTLYGDGLFLARINDSEREQLKELFASDSMAPLFEQGTTIDIINDVVALHAAGFMQTASGHWILKLGVFNEKGELIGSIGLALIAGTSRVEVSYGIDSKFRGMGYATKALKLLVEYAKDELQVTSVSATIDVDNRPSIKVVESLGFEVSVSPDHRPADPPFIFYRLELN